MKLIFIFLIFINIALCQRVHSIPFGSKNNIFELEIFSDENQTDKELQVKITDKPEWLEFKSDVNIISDNRETILFEFDVSKNAPIKTEESIEVVISNSSGDSWSKRISFEIKNPEKFELNQNYPNPFNPSTNISYVLAEEAKVSVLIYDILGRKITELINETQDPGFHKISWNASNYSSGVYFCILTAKSPLKKKFISRKKMLLIK